MKNCQKQLLCWLYSKSRDVHGPGKGGGGSLVRGLRTLSFMLADVSAIAGRTTFFTLTESHDEPRDDNKLC